MSRDKFVAGIDYGTDSVRTVIINAHNGQEISSSVFYYPRWRDQMFCDAVQHQFRQHPLDYLEGLEQTLKNCLREAGTSVADNLCAISVDTTGSSPVAVDRTGTPLSLLPGMESNPHAMFVLWKDHTAIQEAEEINRHAKKFPVNYLQYVGGIYSSEWFWAKLLKVLRTDPAVRQHLYSWVEHCDWIPFVLTGGKSVSEMKRSRCAAGHKALWAEEFGGLPPDDFFSSLDSLLTGITKKLFTHTFTSDQSAGTLSAEWAQRLGLSQQVVIGVGAFDAHMGAVGGQIEPYHLSKVMGTSTCDMMVTPPSEMQGKLVKGICGQVDGSVIPGMIGLEAGQSAFGDSYAWFRNLLGWPLENLLSRSALLDPALSKSLKEDILSRIIPELSKAADELPLSEVDEISIDWLNGRRTPDANQHLRSTLSGLNLATDAPRLFKSIAESTCFGALAIVERFIQEGVPVNGLIGIGGVAKKSPYIMQMMADVMNRPIRIHQSEQTCAVGAAMFAATASGIYARVEEAMHVMGQGFDAEYLPRKERAALHSKRYELYKQIGNFIETNQGIPS